MSHSHVMTSSLFTNVVCGPLFSSCPPISSINPARLISIKPAKPFECNDKCRHLLWSAFLQSVYAKKRGLSLTGVFDETNVGVIEEMGILAFRSIVPEEDTSANKQSPGHHQEFASFAESFLSSNHGPGTLQQLPEWDRFLQSSSLPEEQLIYHSVFFPDNAIATLFFDIHRLLKHEFPCRTLRPDAANILLDIHSVYSDIYVARVCAKDPFLKNFLGAHQPAARAKRILGSPGQHFVRHPHGSTIVDISRHAVTHAIEGDVMQEIINGFPQVDRGLLNSYTREELIRKLRYDFDRYAQAALDAFWNHHSSKCKSWSKLEMSQRLQIPGIFLHTSAAENSSGEQVATNN